MADQDQPYPAGSVIEYYDEVAAAYWLRYGGKTVRIYLKSGIKLIGVMIEADFTGIALSSPEAPRLDIAWSAVATCRVEE